MIDCANAADRPNKTRLLDLIKEAGKVESSGQFGQLSGTEKGYRGLTAPRWLSGLAPQLLCSLRPSSLH